MVSLFKKKNLANNPDSYLRNDECKKALLRLLSEDGDKMVTLMMAWEVETGNPKKPIEGYQEVIGVEPMRAIHLADQWHHRLQHEGLKDYD